MYLAFVLVFYALKKQKSYKQDDIVRGNGIHTGLGIAWHIRLREQR